MSWTYRFADPALKQLAKLDRQAQVRIISYLDDRVVDRDDPRYLGKPLKGVAGELWRYRVGDYRIICDLRDDELVVLVLTVGHRSKVYRKQ